MWGWALNHFKRKTENLSNANAKRFEMDRRATLWTVSLFRKTVYFIYLSLVCVFLFRRLIVFYFIFLFRPPRGPLILQLLDQLFEQSRRKHEKHIRTLISSPLCSPPAQHITTLTTYYLHIPHTVPKPDERRNQLLKHNLRNAAAATGLCDRSCCLWIVVIVYDIRYTMYDKPIQL